MESNKVSRHAKLGAVRKSHSAGYAKHIRRNKQAKRSEFVPATRVVEA